MSAMESALSTDIGLGHQSMYSPLSQVIRREPVTCPPHISVREVLGRISQQKVGSMVIADPQTNEPLGIFTLRDLGIEPVA